MATTKKEKIIYIKYLIIKNLFHIGQKFLIFSLRKNLELGIIFGYIQTGQKKISIVPKRHLVSNIGFVKGATHTKMEYKEWFHDLKTSELHLNDLEPKLKKPNLDYDMWLSKETFLR